MTTQITVSAAGVSKAGKTILNTVSIREALKGMYPKPSTRKGEVTLTARIRLAVADDVITSGEARALQMEAVN